MTGTEQELRLPMADGVELALTLYLPAPEHGPQPCLVEALPYRKDDLTSSYAESYVGLRDRHGFAVCRVDLRGTGSSAGDATDEYPLVERTDLATVIAWLAEQDWCNGNVGLWGTSYSGFNSLQLAVERPPALRAICAIYATDDRWTDDVHWRGGALRLVDLVDYCHYMTPMCVLPPVPAVWGDGWEAEWRRRLESNEPWLLTWLRENRHGPYWDHGSVRLGGTHEGYDRIACPVMIIAGWADGYRNNSFRTVARLAEAGVPHRLLAGPWAHADATTAMPGPRVALDIELAAWFDRWLRPSADAAPYVDGCDVFVRASTRPAPDLDLHEGRWLALPSVPPTSVVTVPLDGPRELVVSADVGTAAWIDCAGHLPWGQSGDQRADDVRSLTWDGPPPAGPIIGHPVARLRVTADQPLASLSVKLCDVFADGTSALVSRGTVDLAFRDGVHGEPVHLGARGRGGRGGRAGRLRLRLVTRADLASLRGRDGLAQHHRSAGSGDADRVGSPGAARPLRRVPRTVVHPRRPALLGVRRGRRLGDPRRRAAAYHLGGDPADQRLPHAVRRTCARVLPRRGLGPP